NQSVMILPVTHVSPFTERAGARRRPPHDHGADSNSQRLDRTCGLLTAVKQHLYQLPLKIIRVPGVGVAVTVLDPPEVLLPQFPDAFNTDARAVTSPQGTSGAGGAASKKHDHAGAQRKSNRPLDPVQVKYSLQAWRPQSDDHSSDR